MILYLDVFSGISGDMTLGAFIDLGVPKDWIEKQLMPLFKGFSLRTQTVFRHHLRAVDLFVDIADDQSSRHYTDIKKLIAQSSLPEKVKANSLAAFEKIARAESFIHGKDMDTVHFHEIGGLDSLVDIIGTFLCVDYLGIEKVYSSAIPLGSGFVECAHGRIPVPVPATIAILRKIPVTGSDAKTEIVTPTGAAIVATLASSFGPMPGMQIQKIGYGAGKRTTGSTLPNLLRMVLGQPCSTQAESDLIEKPEFKNLDNTDNKALNFDQIYVVKTNVDDMSPEILGFLMDLLFEKGALDVFYSSVHMKKNRPGTLIEVLVKPCDLLMVTDLILTQTSSIGVRFHKCERRVLERKIAFADTSFGRIQVKEVIRPDKKIHLIPEYEVLKNLALENDIPLKEVYDRVAAQLNPLDMGKGRI